jgi:hypothetical protein
MVHSSANLVAAHPKNVNSVRHGLYSTRVLAPRASAIAEQLMKMPHIQPLDSLAAEEIASIIVRLEAIDLDLEERGHFGRGGAGSLLQHKARLTRELRSWLREFGGTPKARFDFASRMNSSNSLADAINRLRETP